MRHLVATRLLSAVGATPRFVDDVVGDLEEISAQRREASESSGALWYTGEVLRSLPHACRDGLRGSATTALVDVTQKAIAAWVLLAMAALIGLAMLVFGTGALRANANLGPAWVRSNNVILLVFVAVALRYPLLGYVTAWMDSRRPLITLLTVASLDAFLHALLVNDQTGLSGVVLPALAWSLIMLGGLWRVFRGSVAGPGELHAAATETVV